LQRVYKFSYFHRGTLTGSLPLFPEHSKYSPVHRGEKGYVWLLTYSTMSPSV